MIKGLKLVHKAGLLVGIPLAFQLACYSVLYLKLSEVDRERQAEEHQKAIVLEINNVYRNLIAYTMGMSSNFITKSTEYQGRVSNAQTTLKEHFANLENLVSDSPKLAAQLTEPKKQLDEMMRICGMIGEAVSAGRKVEALMQFKELREVVRSTMGNLDETLKEVIQETVEHSHEEQRQMVASIMGVGVTVDIAVAVLTAVLVIRNWSLRIGQLMDNARRFADGRPPGKIMTGSDEISQLDGKFHAMTKTLEEVAAKKQALLSMITHDLRAPLTSVRGTLTLLESGMGGDLSQKTKASIESADRDLQHVMTLVNDILAIEKMKAGKLDLNLDIYDLQALLNRVIQGFRARTGGRDVELTSTHAQVLVDDHWFCRVAEEILYILSQYSRSELHLRAVVTDRPEASEICFVGGGNKGEAVDLQQLEVIFQPGKLKTAGKIGLSPTMCRAIIGQLGGQVGVRADASGKLEVWFTVPRETDPETDAGCAVLNAENMLTGGGSVDG